METKFSIAATRVKVYINQFCFCNLPYNGSYPCSEIPLIFYLIRKGSISLGKYLLGVSWDHDLNEANHPICHRYLGTTIFLPAFQFVSNYLLVYVCLGISLYLMDYSGFVCVCAHACVYRWLWIANACGNCEYFGEKKDYKIHMYIFYLLIQTFHTNTKT